MGRLTVRTARAVGACALLLAMLASAPTAIGATSDFGTPTARSSFEEGVTFEQPVRFGGEVARAEVMLSGADDALGTFVEEVPIPPGSDSWTLSHTLGDEPGSLRPNTPLTARWRVTYADGSFDVGPRVSVTYSDDRFDWQTKRGDIVRVHWYEGDAAFADRALRIGEEAISGATDLLGVSETEPVDFFIYASQDAFYEAMGPELRENVGGLALTETRTLFAWIRPGGIDESYVGTVVPHELAHLVFDTAVDNPYHAPPHWLDEGVAVYLAQGYDESDRGRVSSAVRGGDLMPLEALNGQFPTSAERFFLAYAESVSAIAYLIEAHGEEALVGLIRSYADGLTDDEAFRQALGVDTAGFAEAWLADLGAETPTRHGPQDAPRGPLPADWSGPPPGGAAGETPPPSGAAAPASPAASTQPGGGDVATAGDATGTILAVAIVAGVALLAGAYLIVRQRGRGGAAP